MMYIGTIIFYLWVGSIVAVSVIASNKNRNVLGWLIFAFFCGPLPLLILSFLNKIETEKKMQPQQVVDNPETIKLELNKVKSNLIKLQDKIKSLSQRIDNLATREIKKEVKQDKKEARKIDEKKVKKQVAAKKESINREFIFGEKWLNKIGIIIFIIGIASLISYSFQYFGALYKIILGYLVGAGLFYFGLSLEKKKHFINYGRVCLSGAWAIIYFTTYAMYHFQASRVINSQIIDLLLLAAVTAGIIIHSLKYKSQILAGIALGMGYVTVTLGNINYFTFISTLILAIAVLLLIYRMKWVELIFVGVFLTYFVHIFWVLKHLYVSPVPIENINVASLQIFINLGFLFVYWFVFLVGINFLSHNKRQSFLNKLSAANFCNFILFFLISYPKISGTYPGSKFSFIFGLGIIYLLLSFLMERIKNKKLFKSNIIIAVSLLTLAIPLKFTSYHTNLIWLVELPFLLVIGLIFKRKLFRYFSYILALFLFAKFMIFDFATGREIYALGSKVSWDKTLSLFGFISMSGCFWLIRYFKEKISNFKKERLANVFTFLGVAYLIVFNWKAIDMNWLTLALSGEVIGLFIVGWLLKDKNLRLCSLFLYLLGAINFLVNSSYPGMTITARRFIVVGALLCFYLFYVIYRYFINSYRLKQTETSLAKIIYIFTTFLAVFAVYRYVPDFWISLGFGIVGAVYFIVGFILQDKIFRLGGFIIFGLTFLELSL